MVVSVLHRLVEREVSRAKVTQELFHLRELFFPMLGVFGAILPLADLCILEGERDDAAQEVFFSRVNADRRNASRSCSKASVGFVAQDHDHVIGNPDSLHEA